MATEAELVASAVAHAKKTTISWDEYLRRVKDPNYPYKNTEWHKAGADLERTKAIVPAPTPRPPIAIRPKADLSLVQNVLILADDPWPALESPAHYKIWITADLGYRHIYEDGSFIRACRDQGRRVESWCDCKAILGDGTPPEVALEMARRYNLDGACGEGEHALAFKAGYDAGMRRFVVNLSALTVSQLALLDGTSAVVTAELYLNKQPGMTVDWKNCAGVGSNCGATYASAGEGAVATPISTYANHPNAVYPTMSWYCGGNPKPDFARLP